MFDKVVEMAFRLVNVEPSYPHLKALHSPIQTRPAEMPMIPNLRLLIPNMDLLCRIAACCFSSCDMPEK